MEQQPVPQPTIEARLLPGDGPFPNNPQLPLLIYRQALPTSGADAAGEVERLFRANDWGGAWRNGVFPFDHYHSNAHEVLGVCAGRARVRFGGPTGPVLSVAAGDVAVLPAGTSHKRVEASADFLVVGAYPAGQERYDLIRGEPAEQVAAVPLPMADPVYGEDGPLFEHWPES